MPDPITPPADKAPDNKAILDSIVTLNETIAGLQENIETIQGDVESIKTSEEEIPPVETPKFVPKTWDDIPAKAAEIAEEIYANKERERQ